MPWQEQTIMSQRLEFVRLATQEGANIRALCQRYQISPPTAYKWLVRFDAEGVAGLVDRSRRPHSSPAQTPAEIEQQVLLARAAHPTWGGRKLRAWLLAHGHTTVPSASTITAILDRHDCLDPARRPSRDPVRFVYAAPNDLWQVDFMGHVALGTGRVHPLTVLDDHSRFLVGVFACANEQQATVMPRLTQLFRQYGLPWRILTDNGPPWGDTGSGGITALELWWIRLGITVVHGRPRHPQTQGKVERLHRTLAAERLQPYRYPDLATCQQALETWRAEYNLERPHEALALAVPASHYQLSPRPFPEVLPPIEYAPGDAVRLVMKRGYISYQARRYKIGTGFEGLPVAVRPTVEDGVMAVYFCQQRIKLLDLRQPDAEE